jgi:hypothetical protein
MRAHIRSVKYQENFRHSKQDPPVNIIRPLDRRLSVLVRLQEQMALMNVAASRIDNHEQILLAVVLFHETLDDI